jgi:hypothetical protein
MRPYIRGFVVIAILASVAGVRTASAADVDTTGRDSAPTLTGFYTGPVGNVGTFRGKLLCLCCDLGQDAEAAKKCDAHGHHSALALDGDAMIHPLLAGTEEVEQQLNSDALHGKEVLVTGKYYPSTGLVFVQNVRVAE